VRAPTECLLTQAPADRRQRRTLPSSNCRLRPERTPRRRFELERFGPSEPGGTSLAAASPTAEHSEPCRGDATLVPRHANTTRARFSLTHQSRALPIGQDQHETAPATRRHQVLASPGTATLETHAGGASRDAYSAVPNKSSPEQQHLAKKRLRTPHPPNIPVPSPRQTCGPDRPVGLPTTHQRSLTSQVAPAAYSTSWVRSPNATPHFT
jgi:hypothetical protein